MPVFDSYFLEDKLPTDQRLVLILLNWRLPTDTLAFWSRAQLRICADGAANRLHDGVAQWTGSSEQQLQEQRKRYLPHIIAGDLDSIRPDVRAFYEQQGQTEILDFSADQDSTDLHKSLECAAQRIHADTDSFPNPDNVTILALGAMGGRLDHTMGNLSTLFADSVTTAGHPGSSQLHKGLHLVLLGDGCTARCIPKGHSSVRPCRQREGPSCGVVALAGPTTGSFTGLRWNLTNARMEMGALQSTCNIIDADEITFDMDAPVLWTTQLRIEE